MNQPLPPPYPGQWRPHPVVQPTPRPRRRLLAGCLITAAALLALVLIVAAVLLYRALPPGIGDHRRLTFHPDAPAGAWLSADYANGASLVELGEEVLAITSDQRLAVVSNNSPGNPLLSAIDLDTQQIVWQLSVICPIGSVMGDEAFCYEPSLDIEQAESLVQIDLFTGEASELWPSIGLLAMDFVGRHGDDFIVMFGDSLAAVDRNANLVWHVDELPQTFPRCEVIGQLVGCSGYQAYQVYDASTGAPLTPMGSLDQSKLETVYWGTDGFSVGPSTTVNRRVGFKLYDYDGNQIGDAVNATPPLNPGSTSGHIAAPNSYYPVAELADGDKVEAVDQSGRVVVSRDRFNTALVFHDSGTKLSGYLEGVSADGNVIAISGVDETVSGFYDSSGQLLHAEQTASLMSGVLGGLIVFDTAVLVPNHS